MKKVLSRFHFSSNIVISIIGMALCLLAYFATVSNLSGTDVTINLILFLIEVFVFLAFGIYSAFFSKNTSKLGFTTLLSCLILAYVLTNLIYSAVTKSAKESAILHDTINYTTDTARELAAREFLHSVNGQIAFYSLALASFPFFIFFLYKKALDGQSSVWFGLSFAAFVLFLWFAGYFKDNFFNNLTTLDAAFWATMCETRCSVCVLILTYIVSLRNDFDPYVEIEAKKRSEAKAS
jgi:hypothetical protein